MDFEIDPVGTGGDCSARQRLGVLPKSAGLLSGGARQLERMSDVEDDRDAVRSASWRWTACRPPGCDSRTKCPRSVTVIRSLPVLVAFSTARRMSSGAMNCPFLMFTGSACSLPRRR